MSEKEQITKSLLLKSEKRAIAHFQKELDDEQKRAKKGELTIRSF